MFSESALNFNPGCFKYIRRELSILMAEQKEKEASIEATVKR